MGNPCLMGKELWFEMMKQLLYDNDIICDIKQTMVVILVAQHIRQIDVIDNHQKKKMLTNAIENPI